MEAVTHDHHTDIRLTHEEAKTRCGLGTGPECCIWLCIGGEGFECLWFNKPPSLVERLEKGETNAKRDGCGLTLADLAELIARH